MPPDTWPLCRFHAPRWVFPGDEIDVGVDLLCDVEIEVDRIELFVVAKNGLGMVKADNWMEGQLTTEHEQRTFQAVLPLVGKTKLLKGLTVFATKFVVPEDTPPSHSFGGAFAYLGMEARVIYEKDRTYLYWNWTRVRPSKRAITRPSMVRASEAAGLEVALATSEIASGEALEGAVVARDTGGRATQIELELVAELAVPKRPMQRFVAVRQTLAMPAGSGGLPVPFRFRIPEIMPSFSATSHALVWQLHARRAKLLGRAAPVVLPLAIIDVLLAQDAPVPTTIPPFNGDHVARAFQEHASRPGWTLFDQLYLDEPLGALRPVCKRKLADSELAIAFAFRRDGMFLVSRVTYPRLGLELRATRERRLLAGDIEVGVPVWDPAHHLQARTKAQALPFARAVVDCLVAIELGELVRWSDDEIVYTRRIRDRAPLLGPGDLEATERKLAELAAVIGEARKRIAAPAVVDLEAWRLYVRELRGTLTDGDLSIDGKAGTFPVAIRVRWTRGRPAQVHVAIGDAETASDDARAVFLETPHPVAEAKGVAAQVSWPEDVVDLLIAEGVVEATWNVPGGELDVGRVRSLVETLQQLRRGLDVEIGPYR